MRTYDTISGFDEQVRARLDETGDCHDDTRGHQAHTRQQLNAQVVASTIHNGATDRGTDERAGAAQNKRHTEPRAKIPHIGRYARDHDGRNGHKSSGCKPVDGHEHDQPG